MSWKHGTLEERFWAKVDKSPRPTGCWEWTGSTDADGYGRLRLGTREAGVAKTHRLSWELAHGHIPDGLLVCHSCDNPRCVNPAHLFLGTIKDNVVDSVSKGRRAHQKAAPRGPRPRRPARSLRPPKGQCRGVDSPRAKLTNGQVLEIRALAARKVTRPIIAKRFNVSVAEVNNIVRRVTWKHLP